jgi:cysteine desulfurase family protein
MIYLDNASTTYPKPESVYHAMDRFFRESAVTPGRGAYESAVEAGNTMAKTRKLIASFFGTAGPDRVIFTLNTTDALNIAIKGILRKGDHVVTTHLEHNSVSRPLAKLEKTGMITVTKVDNSPDGFVDPDDVKAALKKNTKLVVMTHASNVLGTIQPISEIGEVVRNHSAFLLVDCAQTAGVIPINLEETYIDMLAFPGHKALLGPPGTGGLCLGKDIELNPWREGGTGVDSISRTQPTDMPFRLEAGTPNTVGIVGLREGMNFVGNKGIATIWKHEIELVDRLISQLADDKRFTIYGSKDAAKHVGCVSINIDGMKPGAVGLDLDRLGSIAVRAGLHCAPYVHQKIGSFPDGSVRISPGYFSTTEDVDVAVETLRRIADKKQ